MKLVVLGATGGLGQQIIRKALQHSYQVTACVRSPDSLQSFADQIKIKRCDLLSSVELAEIIRGQDAVMSAFGHRQPIAKGDSNLLQRFAGAVTVAMSSVGVKRLVIASTSFLFKDSILPPAYLIGRIFFTDVVDDAYAMERKIRDSVLDWTIVRPPRLTDEPYTGQYRVQEGHLPLLGFSISRSNAAACMLKSLEDPETIEKIYGVSD